MKNIFKKMKNLISAKILIPKFRSGNFEIFENFEISKKNIKNQLALWLFLSQTCIWWPNLTLAPVDSRRRTLGFCGTSPNKTNPPLPFPAKWTGSVCQNSIYELEFLSRVGSRQQCGEIKSAYDNKPSHPFGDYAVCTSTHTTHCWLIRERQCVL